MSDSKNLLLRDEQASAMRRSTDLLDRKLATPSAGQRGALEDQESGSSDNFRSLTYVSSRGFFFH